MYSGSIVLLGFCTNSGDFFRIFPHFFTHLALFLPNYSSHSNGTTISTLCWVKHHAYIHSRWSKWRSFFPEMTFDFFDSQAGQFNRIFQNVWFRRFNCPFFSSNHSSQVQQVFHKFPSWLSFVLQWKTVFQSHFDSAFQIYSFCSNF